MSKEYERCSKVSYRQLFTIAESAFRAKGCSTAMRREVLLAKCTMEGEELSFVLERDLEGNVRLSLLTDEPAEGKEELVVKYNFFLFGVKVMEDSEGYIALATELPESCLLNLGASQIFKEAEKLAAIYRNIKKSIHREKHS
ncbi:MAG: hypothetical protein C0179_02065 [Fervidicoccus sp.]|nr:MAG: hypothetical protein C0179_02065 [Fervidicoccus sp.]